MVKPYEAEVRAFVGPEALDELLRKGFKVIKEYSFTDYFYCPPGGWREEGKTLRVRDWGDRAELLFTKVEKFKYGDIEFKRSVYPEGKVKLYEGSAEECKRLAEDMEFELCCVVKKEKGFLLSDGELTVALELIDGKWVLEVEVEGSTVEEAREALKKATSKLGIKPTSKSTFELFCQ